MDIDLGPFGVAANVNASLLWPLAGWLAVWMVGWLVCCLLDCWPGGWRRWDAECSGPQGGKSADPRLGTVRAWSSGHRLFRSLPLTLASHTLSL